MILTLVFHYRVRREHIWKKAVEWIATSDSRVRVESQMIAGEQFDVWKWIHLDPPATEVKYHASLLLCIVHNELCVYCGNCLYVL